MIIKIITIGRDRKDDYASLIDRYRTRLPWTVTLIEKLPKKPNAPTAQRMQEEADLLLAAAAGCDLLVALDEHGDLPTSEELARRFGRWQQSGATTIAFLIGGADGLHPDILRRADARLAFGALTWPHQMVRLMLVEQFYRVHTILSGHPYHRQ